MHILELFSLVIAVADRQNMQNGEQNTFQSDTEYEYDGQNSSCSDIYDCPWTVSIRPDNKEDGSLPQ